MRAEGIAKVLIRLPVDAKSWIEQQAQRNMSSQNSEIIRCVRDKMDEHKLQQERAA